MTKQETSSDFLSTFKDTQTILNTLKRKVPLQVKMSALLVASNPNKEEIEEINEKEKSRIKRDISYLESELKKNPDDEQAKRIITRLKEELSTNNNSSNDVIYSLDENNLRKRLHVIFGAYLAYLDEKDKNGLEQALNIIEQNIAKRNQFLSSIRRQLKMKDAKTIENFIMKQTEKYISPVDKITNKLFNPHENPAFYENQEVLVEVGQTGSKNKKTVLTAVSVFFDEDKGISFSNNVMLNQYNNAVHSAVCSMYYAGNNICTLNSLYHVLTGNSPTAKTPSKQIIEEIKNSLRKMAMTRIKINTENEAQKFNQIPVEVKTIERNLLYVDFITAKVNGQIVECAKFLAKPPLLEYAEYKKQIASYDIKILNVPLSLTRENTIIRNYLLDQILIMKNPKSKRNNVIRYDTIYKNLELEAPTDETLRAKKRDVRGKVHVILEHWKKEGFIKGYSDDIKEGNEIVKVEIYF